MMGKAVGLAASVLFAATAAAEDPVWVEHARNAAERLGGALKAELTSALSNAGPADGVSICRERAPAIASNLSDEDLRVGRTAARVRNPNNAPDPWERGVLESFARRMESGQPTAALEHWEVREVEGRRVGRWMKAIPMQPQCILCHGPSISEPLVETIARLYPDDDATGFEVGELRGAFTVRVDLSGEAATVR